MTLKRLSKKTTRSIRCVSSSEVRVFKKNQVERYLSFDDFKDAMFILQSNPDLELLSYEYQAKLAEPRLTAVDRSRIEEEFRKKRESLKSASFSLNFRTAERVLRTPQPMMNKILRDTLSTGAQQAAERKGATRYNVPVLSKNTLRKDFMTADDYVVAVDILRSMIERVLGTVDDIARIPGADAVRLGEEQLGLAHIPGQSGGPDSIQSGAVIDPIRITGLSRNVARADVYFADRVLEVQLRREQVRQRMTSLQEALRSYQQAGGPNGGAAGFEGRTGGVTPQVTESFIDRLVQLSTQANDVKYRQDLTDRIIEDGVLLADLNRQAEYYDSTRKAFAAGRQSKNASVEAEVTRRTNQVYSELERSLDQVQAMYKLIAQQNLNPDTVLYTVTSPFVVRATHSLSLRSVFVYFVMTSFAALFLIPIACLMHDYFRHWISPTAPSPRDVSRPSDRGRVAGV